MLTTLAIRHLLVRRLRSLFLLFGFSLGVGVMIVLLSVGEAMLSQSRDVALVGGGEVTALPQGIDIESMRTGGLSGMYFGIDRARFLTRQVLGGSRHADLLRSVSPAIEGKLLYLRHRGRTLAVRAGGEIPSRAASVGSGLNVRAGTWRDSPRDSAYVAPNPQQLYDELDRFHLPPRPDSSWAEWHYFNIVTAPDEWWYITYLVGGDVQLGQLFRSETQRWGGQLLVTHRRPDGEYERINVPVSSDRISLDTAKADVQLGDSWVKQRDGRYKVYALAPKRGFEMDIELHPLPNRYFPPVELSREDFLSGYVVPALAAEASGRICLKRRCRRLEAAPAYHDHNWGTWRGVTWEWGAAHGSEFSLLYGGVYGLSESRNRLRRSPFFLALVDSLGVKQVLRLGQIEYAPPTRITGAAGPAAPRAFSLTAHGETDTVRLDVWVTDALPTEMSAVGFRRVFLQMRGRFGIVGKVAGRSVADSGAGFFETYIER